MRKSNKPASQKRSTSSAIPVASHISPSQPAEDQEIVSAFGDLTLFISHHVDEFYKPGIPDTITIFDFEPTGATGVKAALRRFIACNVFRLVTDLAESQSNDYTVIKNKCRDKLRHELGPYVHDDPSRKHRWGVHLDEILSEGTKLAQMLSSQNASRWHFGSLNPAITKPPNIIDVLVFPSLFKNDSKIREEEKQRGEGKPRQKQRVPSFMKIWGAKMSFKRTQTPAGRSTAAKS